MIYVKNNTTGLVYSALGGNGGGNLALRKPVVIPGGEQFQGGLGTYANHNVSMAVYFSGYEV
jgi:hypothetical protein